MGRLLTLKKVGEILQLSPVTVRNMCYRENNPIPKIVRRKLVKVHGKSYIRKYIKVLEDDLKEWIKKEYTV